MRGSPDGSTSHLTIIIVVNRYRDSISNLDKAICISHRANTHEKCTNVSFLSPASSK